MFYHFRQNNSGGYFHVNDRVSTSVYIEALSSDEANGLAKSKTGIYFDGAGDCSCCGNRWSECWAADGTSEPMYYDKPITDVSGASLMSPDYWVKVGEPYAIIYYLDGRVDRLIKK